MGIDYAEEAKLLTSGFWKPPVGETAVRVVSEMSDKTTISYRSEYGSAEIEQKADLAIEVDGQKQTWRISVNHSARSLFAQVVLLALELGGLEGKMLKVRRDGEGRETTYSVTKAA